ncbi:glycosyltransferase family 66 protein [Paxillus rubicundulus Ve08.2h10]|uniref:Dolichyl-diphosphooligosaccharide--protein glycosyltransferase subunit STT3 n=2 Tax=Paxillus TaxID=5395 RepID=A0A0D0DML5_9AGAM|nr:glycosyltransferase family 66 protein [Paxillus rubicundulus Ve08.2h10]
MPTAYPLPKDLSPAIVTNTASLLRIIALGLISGAAIASRLFAVVNFESIIHEFDPWFNYRATRVLASKGFYEFWNWFDPTAWYPLGRVVGGTIYPGLMATSGVIYNLLHALHLPVDIRNICVLLAPGFSALTAWATYMFTKELKDESAGLLAAAFIGIVPGYISRSVAGSYDNEAIAIFLLMFTFFCWIKALKQGSAFFGTIAAVFYFYMVAAWGGYVFITNMIPLHALVLLLMGRFSSRLYVAYSTWYAIGTLASMQVPFVGFQPVRTSEHMAALGEHSSSMYQLIFIHLTLTGVFGLLQIVAFAQLVRSHVSSKQFQELLVSAVISAGVMGFFAIVALTYKGWIAPWTGRFYSLWDTGYAKKYIPIIASVSEHQPTAWPSFFMDLHFLIFLFPAGVVMCFRALRDEHVFVIIYAVMASYFAGVMVRLMLTLTPVVCVASAVAMSSLLDTYLDPKEPDTDEQKGRSALVGTTSASIGTSATAAPVAAPKKTKKTKEKEAPVAPGGVLGDLVSGVASSAAAAVQASETASTSKSTKGIFGLDTRFAVIMNTIGLLLFFVLHCTWVTSSAYSSPSVVLASTSPDGSQHIIDDFREAYYWLRQNTAEDAVVMSWWDYGYQIAGMADRPTLVDNNTWNNTHIATVGKAMSSPEEVAYPILRKHDVSYVLVIFGGLIGYSGDDLNKFLWMVRIAQGVWPDEIQEPNYFNKGEYRVDDRASPTMRESLMYKMSYYRFADLFGAQQPMDRVRGQQVPAKGPTLDYLGEHSVGFRCRGNVSNSSSADEAFTSENWIVRIYEVKKDDILGRDLKIANAFSEGKKRKRSKPVSRRKAIRGW